MTFTLSRDELLMPLMQIVNVIEKKQTMPILANVLIKLENGLLTLTGTDLEIQIVAHLEISNNDAVAITVSAKKLADICRSFSNDVQLKFTLNEDQLIVTSGRSRFTLATLAADDYPNFPEEQLEMEVLLSSHSMKKGLEKTAFSMGHQDVRYYLNGLLFNIFNQSIKFIASDGHRMALMDDQADFSCNEDYRLIIPRKAVTELSRILNDSEDEIRFEFSNSNIRVHFNNIVFSAKLINAKYPVFNKIFVQDFLSPITFEKQEIKESLSRIAILANEKSRGVTLTITADNLKISTHNPEHEEADEDIQIMYEGDPLTLSFNVGYLIDAISNIDAEQLIFTAAANGSCAIIEDSENTRYRFVVMSMKI